MNNFRNMTDESLLAYYESVRRQVAADHQLGAQQRLIGGTVRQYAESLRAGDQQPAIGVRADHLAAVAGPPTEPDLVVRTIGLNDISKHAGVGGMVLLLRTGRWT
jgi:hypothetical protein